MLSYPHRDGNITFISWILLCFLPWSLLCQNVIDDFEQALMNNWLVVEGQAEISDAYAYADLFSIRVYQSNASADAVGMVRHRNFKEGFGVFRMKCYVVGSNAAARLRFQYTNEQNYYEVVSRPKDVELPGLYLYKKVNGQLTLIDQVKPLIESNNWYQITIHRTCAGEIFIFTNDVLRLAVVDTDLLALGSIGLGSAGGSTYYDDIVFSKEEGSILIEIDTVICHGSSLNIGSRTYDAPGNYLDTIKSDLDCDSVFQIHLQTIEKKEIFISDTICSQEIYVFGEDTLTESGFYRQVKTTTSGCDSITNLTLYVLNGSNHQIDQVICPGDFVLFKGRDISTSGRYIDTFSLGPNCTGIITLDLRIANDSSFLGEDTTLCFDALDDLVIGKPHALSLWWSDGSYGPLLEISVPGTYWADLQMGNCLIRDSITVKNWCDPNQNLYIPNAFSPNADGINDLFLPLLTETPNQYRMTIFNRYGQVIFSTTSPLEGWNGTWDHKPLPQGIYLYQMKTDQAIYHGDLTLIR